MVKNHFKIIGYRCRSSGKSNQFVLVTYPSYPPSFVQIRPQLFEISCLQTNKHRQGWKHNLHPPSVTEVPFVEDGGKAVFVDTIEHKRSHTSRRMHMNAYTHAYVWTRLSQLYKILSKITWRYVLLGSVFQDISSFDHIRAQLQSVKPGEPPTA